MEFCHLELESSGCIKEVGIEVAALKWYNVMYVHMGV